MGGISALSVPMCVPSPSIGINQSNFGLGLCLKFVLSDNSLRSLYR